MYLGSDFHRYWARCGRQDQHPDDVGYLQNSPFAHTVRPCPFDGPLDRAKVVICLANPSYGEDRDVNQLNQLVMSLRSGEEPLPDEFDDFYRRITRTMGVSLDRLRHLVAVLNVCPYASASMSDAAIKKAAGLPSVWQAQKFLREVLIPRAQTGNIYLVLIRKLQLWGITQGSDEDGNLRVIPDRAINGVMPVKLGTEIREWLTKKGNLKESQTDLSRAGDRS